MFGCSKKARATSRTRSGSTMACAKKRGKFGFSSFHVVANCIINTVSQHNEEEDIVNEGVC